MKYYKYVQKIFKIYVSKIYRHPKDTATPSELTFVRIKPIAFIQ